MNPKKHSSSLISCSKSELLRLLLLFFVAEAMAKNPGNLSFKKVRSDAHIMSQ
jgi:hypothetical protein